MRPFLITTKEKRERDKTKISITKSVGIFGVRQKFEASPGAWRTENIRALTSKPTFKRRTPSTPRGPFARDITHRPVDLQMYKNILENSATGKFSVEFG